MNKAVFKYTKSDGTSEERVVIRPVLLKESSNALKDFSNPNVNYLHGYVVNRAGLPGTEIAKYEKLIEEYFTIAFPTLEQFALNNGLDPKKIEQKTFKKTGIADLKIL